MTCHLQPYAALKEKEIKAVEDRWNKHDLAHLLAEIIDPCFKEECFTIDETIKLF